MEVQGISPCSSSKGDGRRSLLSPAAMESVKERTQIYWNSVRATSNWGPLLAPFP